MGGGGGVVGAGPSASKAVTDKATTGTKQHRASEVSERVGAVVRIGATDAVLSGTRDTG